MFRRISFCMLTAVFITVTVSAQVDGLSKKVRYDDWRFIQVVLETPADLDTMMSISQKFLASEPGLGQQNWIVPPERMEDLTDSGLSFVVLYKDFQKLLDEEQTHLQEPGRGWYDNYKNLAEIDTRIDYLVDTWPNLATKFEVGESIEGRMVYGVKITSPVGADKPALLFNGTQHAREWISPMTVMFIGEQLASTYDSDPEVHTLLDDASFYIVPVVNPDGYRYSWVTDRMWRKNRRDNGGGSYGVDTNRNWATGWGGAGSSSNPWDETYHGTAPFSEPETANVRDFIYAHPDIRAHIDFHSYSQLILYPYGYDYVLPDEPDLSIFVMLSADMAAAIYNTHGKVYVDQPTYNLYLASGVMSDWVYDEPGIFAWTIELRPDSAWPGFELPPEEIIPTGEENFAAIKVLAGYVTQLLKFDFPNGLPAIVEAEQTADIDVTIIEISGTLDPESPKLFQRIGSSGPFTQSALTPLGGLDYLATLPAAPCAEEIQYYFQAETTDGQTVTDPEDAPFSLHVATAYEITIAFEDDMEADLGWTVGAAGDDAITGIWNRMDPEGTAAQPENDHTPDGTYCWVTDGRAGSGLGSYDVDGGQTTLTSPLLDLSATEDPVIGYWRWYSNDKGASPNADVFVVDISSDNGDTWTNVETVGPTGPESSGGWFYHEFRVSEFAQLTDQVKMRFIASDEGSGSIVEAAIDDFAALDVGCGEPECPGDLNGDGLRDLADLAILLTHYGTGGGATYEDGDIDGDGDVDLADLAALLAVYGVPCD